MKRIFYPGGSVLTGSELADAVLQYAEALSTRREVDVIDIPVVDAGGLAGRAQFLIGSDSQLVSVTADAAEVELIEYGTTALLRRKAMDRAVMTPVGTTAEDHVDFAQFDEFDY
ncbi:MAG: hypothetical protein ABIX44_02130 [Cryobacterium sp.]